MKKSPGTGANALKDVMALRTFLIPNELSEGPRIDRPVYADRIGQLRVFFVEEFKSARRLLKGIFLEFPLQECVFYELSEHTSREETKKNFHQSSGKDIGIISEAGCPNVADPGAYLVLLSHQEGREVIPLVGPSSVLLALMASGLNGQNFAFCGYLPRERDLRIQKLRDLEKRSAEDKQTQIFIETPYRNDHLMTDILEYCRPDTLLCVAADLTAPEQFIRTLPVIFWKKQKPVLSKRPAVFLLSRP